MKKILFALLIISTHFVCAQQVTDYKNRFTDNKSFDFPPANPKYYKDINHYFDPFLGTWKYNNGNKTFIVTLWKETMRSVKDIENLYTVYYTDNIYGHYKMIQDYGMSNQQLLYTSEINVTVTSTQWPSIIYADATEPNVLDGHLYDINTNYPEWPLRGFLKMTINAGSSPVTAHWKVIDSEEKLSATTNYNFVIPKDITLTKQ